MDEELRAHFARQVEKLVAEGLPLEEARRRARLGFGGYEQIKEECRDARGVSFWDALKRDVAYGLRVLRKNPGFTTIATLTLVLGIGANTAIFSVVNAALLQPLPYADPASLVMVWETNSQLPVPNPHNTVSPPDYFDWKRQTDIFSAIAAIFDQRANLTGVGLPEQVILQDVTIDFFSVLGVQPILGSGFAPENGQKGHDDVVILSYGIWKERFGGDPDIVGKSVTINGHPLAIVGVAPQNFQWFIKDGSQTGAKPQMWTPFVFPAEFSERKNVGRFLTVVARLKPGVSPRQAQTQMAVVAARIARDFPEFNGNWGAVVLPVREQISGDLRPALLVLFGAVALVLLIACANVSSLLLARAAQRERELAVRVAIGASPWQIARQLLTESILLAFIGGVVGMGLASWGTNALLAASPANLLDLNSASMDWRVLAFAVGSTLAAGLLFGFLPSSIAGQSETSETLKEGGRGGSGARQRSYARSAFVVAQMCLALVLLTGSGLLIRSFVRLAGVEPGFDSSHLLTFKVSLPDSRYKDDPARLAFFRNFLARISNIPGVRAATMNSYPPFSGLGAGTAVHILSQPSRPLMDLPDALVRVVGPNYFSTMHIPLRAGRDFQPEELTQERHVVIVDQAFVDRYLSGVNPLGQKAVIFMKSLEESKNPPCEIIGVAGDVRQIGLDSPVQPTVYWPHPELLYDEMAILVRTANDPLVSVSAVRNELRQMDPELPMAGIATMDERLAGSISRSRFTMLLLGIFAVIALVLASVGIYGLVAYTVAQRTREFGVRMALGANRRDVLRLVLRHGARLTLLGIGLGVVASLAITRLLTTLLYSTSATDPLTFTAVALLLALVALAACYIPARRATRVDPIVALRYE